MWNYCSEKLFFTITPLGLCCSDHYRPIRPLRPLEEREPMVETGVRQDLLRGKTLLYIKTQLMKCELFINFTFYPHFFPLRSSLLFTPLLFQVLNKNNKINLIYLRFVCFIEKNH